MISLLSRRSLGATHHLPSLCTLNDLINTLYPHPLGSMLARPSQSYCLRSHHNLTSVTPQHSHCPNSFCTPAALIPFPLRLATIPLHSHCPHPLYTLTAHTPSTISLPIPLLHSHRTHPHSLPSNPLRSDCLISIHVFLDYTRLFLRSQRILLEAFMSSEEEIDKKSKTKPTISLITLVAE